MDGRSGGTGGADGPPPEAERRTEGAPGGPLPEARRASDGAPSGPLPKARRGSDGIEGEGWLSNRGWSLVLVAVAVAVFAVFLHSAGGVLNPFVLFWVLVAALLPWRGRPGHTALVVTAAAVTFLWVLSTTGFLLAPFVLALILAYILDPLVDRLDERLGPRIGRGAAIAILTVPTLALLALALVAGAPALGEQLAELIRQTPVLLQRLADWLEATRDRLLALPVPGFADEILLERLREVDAESVIAFLEERQQAVVERIWTGILGFGRGLGSFLTVVGYVVLTPVLTYYLLRDYDRLTTSVRELVPPARRDRVIPFFREYDRLLSGYLRGQLTVAIIIGTLTGLGLWIVSFPYAFLIGAMVAVFSLVPYLGLVLSLIPAILVALVSGQVLLSLLKVAGVFAVAQGLEASVVSPKIVGESVGLHPVWVVLALTVGGFYFGFVGLLIAVPIAVGVKLVIAEALERYRSSQLFRTGSRSPAEP